MIECQMIECQMIECQIIECQMSEYLMTECQMIECQIVVQFINKDQTNWISLESLKVWKSKGIAFEQIWFALSWFLIFFYHKRQSISWNLLNYPRVPCRSNLSREH